MYQARHEIQETEKVEGINLHHKHIQHHGISHMSDVQTSLNI